MPHESVNPSTLYRPHGHSHAIVASGTRTVFIGGQIASDLDGKIIGARDYAAQGEQTLLNVAAALEATGAEISDLAQMTIYLVGLNSESEEQLFVGIARASAQVKLRRTATALIGVERLSDPSALVEIEAVAVF